MITTARKEAFENDKTGKTSETGENSKNSKNRDKNENSGINLAQVLYI